MPATTMVLECKRAETGVGPSIAVGSHMCIKNWADFPTAARVKPMARSVSLVCWAVDCTRSQVE